MLIVNIKIVKLTLKSTKIISIEFLTWDVLKDGVHNCTTLTLRFDIFFDGMMSLIESNILIANYYKYMCIKWSLSKKKKSLVSLYIGKK